MSPQNRANTRRGQPKEQSTTDETSDKTPEPGPPADETPSAQEEASEQTEDASASTPASAAVQDAAIQAIKTLFSELGGLAKSAAIPSSAGGDSHNQITINVAVLIGNNQWSGNSGDFGTGGAMNNSHGL